MTESKNIENTTDIEDLGNQRNLNKFWKWVAYILAISMSVYHLYVAAFSMPEAMIHRSIHLTFALSLGFLIVSPKRNEGGRLNIIDIVFFIITISSFLYLFLNYEEIANRLLYLDPISIFDYVFAILTIFLIFEMTRRTMGWPLIIVALVFIVYTLLGQYLPGILKHSGVTVEMFVEDMYLTTSGIWGMPTGVSATYVFLFILFGSFLNYTGAGNFFINLASALTNKSKGGPAKASLLASGLFGSISGSAVANVYGTGIFTIKIMKRNGFSPKYAGAVEAVASSGGAILPPVMGSAAFLMADFIGIPYTDIMVAAIIPGLIYYLSLWFIIHKTAVIQDIGSLSMTNKSAKELLFKDWTLLLPLVVITVLLFNDFTPYFAAFWTICTTVVVSLFKKESRLGVKKLLKTLEDGGKSGVAIASAMACASIVVGLINLTGVGLKFTSMLISFSEGNLYLILFFIMIITLILGMGLPTPAAYLIAAIFGPHALIEFGIEPLAAHLFVLYYAALSVLTPPVAMASYAAADIAKADVNQTSFVALKLGITAYIIPWFFIFSPALLMDGNVLSILLAIITAIIGVYALSSGITGLMINRVNWLQRIFLFTSALFLLFSGTISDVIGVVLFLALFIPAFIKRNRTVQVN